MFWTWGSYQSCPEKGGLENFPISGASFRNEMENKIRAVHSTEKENIL